MSDRIACEDRKKPLGRVSYTLSVIHHKKRSKIVDIDQEVVIKRQSTLQVRSILKTPSMVE